MPTPIDPTHAPPLDPARVLTELASSFQSLESLLKLLNCTPDQLAQTLNHPDTQSLFNLRLKVASMQAQLAAAKAVPTATQQLLELAETAEKPEVKRRALTTVLAVAGISTTPPKPPTPPRPPKDEPPQQTAAPALSITQEEGLRFLDQHIICDDLQEYHGCDIFGVPGPLRDDYYRTIAHFFDAHNLPRAFRNGDPINQAARDLKNHPKPPE